MLIFLKFDKYIVQLLANYFKVGDLRLIEHHPYPVVIVFSWLKSL